MSSKNMKWSNLKNCKCPKCGSMLNTLGRFYTCPKCGYRIAKQKFNAIVDDLYKNKKMYEGMDDNLSELNNMDREEATQGFL